MADKSDEGAWAVIRYLPFDTSEGELPAHFDGWFTHRDAAEAVAKDWASQYPEAQVVVVQSVKRTSNASRGVCSSCIHPVALVATCDHSAYIQPHGNKLCHTAFKFQRDLFAE